MKSNSIFDDKKRNQSDDETPISEGLSMSEEDTKIEIECPFRIEYIDKVPEGIRPHHHDRYSIFKSFGKDTTLFYQTNEESMPSCILYHAPTRTRWRLFFSPEVKGSDGVANPDFMSALIKAHDMGAF